MVQKIDKKIFHCPYCACQDEDIDRMREHITDSHEEDPEETREQYYVCEMCSEHYAKEIDATDCEEKHKKFQDIDYINWEDKKEKIKLYDAASHPEQTRLEVE